MRPDGEDDEDADADAEVQVALAVQQAATGAAGAGAGGRPVKRARGGGGRGGAAAAKSEPAADGDGAADEGAEPPLPNFPHGTTQGGHASFRPNPAGRMLRASDIAPSLAGRFAELLWPDDALWYVVQIAAVDARAGTAQIIYSTGEQEDLDLKEILRDEHMSLLPAA